MMIQAISLMETDVVMHNGVAMMIGAKGYDGLEYIVFELVGAGGDVCVIYKHTEDWMIRNDG